MVVKASNWFSQGGVIAPPQDRPMFTSLPLPMGGSERNLENSARIGGSTLQTSKLAWLKFRRNPELVATLSIPITDILSDQIDWTDLDGNKLNKLNEKKARKFWRDQRIKDNVLTPFLFDGFLNGDGFIWKGRPTRKEINAAVKETLEAISIPLSKLEVKELASKMLIDEDTRKTKRVDHLAASSVIIRHNQYDIEGYTQIANTYSHTFKTDEIIHWRYLNLDGKVQGFSPIEALWAEIMLLTLVKQNMISFMRNGGTPDKVFILPKEIANSKNHEYLVETLRKYKRIENAHGNLVFTGELDIKDLQINPKDLEYKDLALYITSNIAFSFGIPVTRIPYLIGTSASKGDSGGLSESGYWNRISNTQDQIEELLNSQLFEEMGWQMHFRRGYKQDEVREAQTANMMADTVTKHQSILAQSLKRPTTKKVLQLLGYAEDDLEDIPEEHKMFAQGDNKAFNQNMQNNSQMFDSQKKQDNNKTKSNVANSKTAIQAVTNT